MPREYARLKPLLQKLQAWYGEDDADVARLREAVQRLERDAAQQNEQFHYVNLSPVSHREARIGRVAL
jgi:hypothetical protein